MSLGRYFEVGTTVIRAVDARWETGENPIQVGTIVAMSEDGFRARVQWPGFPDWPQRLKTNRPKKTWIALTSLSNR